MTRGELISSVATGVFFGGLTAILALVLGVPAVLAGAVVGAAGIAVILFAAGLR